MVEPHAPTSPADAAYDRGDMEIGEHRSTYRAFDGLVRFGGLAVAGLILFLTLMFCTRVGFIGAAAPTVILLIAGGIFLRKQPASVDTL